jgi:hypothetical protein
MPTASDEELVSDTRPLRLIGRAMTSGPATGTAPVVERQQRRVDGRWWTCPLALPEQLEDRIPDSGATYSGTRAHTDCSEALGFVPTSLHASYALRAPGGRSTSCIGRPRPRGFWLYQP